MFLLDDDFKPQTPTQQIITYICGFGLLAIGFEISNSYLRKYLLPERIRLPYALKEWSAEDEKDSYVSSEKTRHIWWTDATDVPEFTDKEFYTISYKDFEF